MMQLPDTSKSGVRVTHVHGMDELMDKIAQTVSDAQQAHLHQHTDSGDIDPDGLEAQLRQHLPVHTFFDSTTQILRTVDGNIPVTLTRAIWSTPDGIWTVTCHPCPEGHDNALYNMRVEGPNTDVGREHRTVEQALHTLRSLEVIPPATSGSPADIS